MDIDFDFDAFFREQDKRMNLPGDSDINDYLARMGTGSRRVASRSTHAAPQGSEESEHTVQTPQARCLSLSGNTVENVIYNAETLESSVRVEKGDHKICSKDFRRLESSSYHGDFSIPDATGSVKNVANHPSRAFEHDAQSSTSSKNARWQSAGAVLESPVASQPETALPPETRKRKPSPGDTSEVSLTKKRLRYRKLLPETPSSPLLEEITSFTATLSPKKRTKGLSEDDTNSRQQVQSSPKKRKIPALKLTALVPPVQAIKVPDDSQPRTSPIEDVNDPFPTRDTIAQKTDNNNKAVLQADPSRLYLEVKERVAQHSSAKRRDKVIKVNDVHKKAVQPSELSIIDISSSPPPLPSTSTTSPSTVINSTATSKRITKDEKSKPKVVKGKKSKPPVMTPVEYATKLREKAALPPAVISKKKSVNKFLEGMNIFYTGGDMHFASEQTRGRMDLIVKYGGNLFPTYDAATVTHIITDASMVPTLKALGLKRLSEIPDHIPTVTWKWIAAGMGRVNKEGWMHEIFLHAAFRERIDAGIKHSRASWKGKEKANDKSFNAAEVSRISEFTQDKPRRETSVHSIHSLQDDDTDAEESDTTGAPIFPPSTSELRHITSASPNVSIVNHPKEDPLAEFYALAKAEHETGWSRNGEGDDSDLTPSDVEPEEPAPKRVAKRGWTCDNKEPQRQTCVNQDIIDKLQELKDLHQAKVGDDDHWRVFSYSKCIRALKNHPKRIESFAEARSIRGVGDKTAAKITEILETGALRRIGYERTEDVEVTRLFQGIYGVGQSTAFKWYSAGCRTLDDLTAGKGGVKLNPAQEIGIRFYDDINDRMPREEAKAIFDLIKPIALKLDPKLFVEIMGSYRRGKKDCGDIDILITRPPDDGKTHKRILPRLLQELHAANILTEDLAVPEDPDDLEAIYRGLCHIPNKDSKRRRIDFLTVPWKSKGAALLYYTGDDIFNRAIRLKAGSMGYSLNQRGLFGGVIRDTKDRRIKLNKGSLVASETEEEIFKILNVPWQEPHERVRG